MEKTDWDHPQKSLILKNNQVHIRLVSLDLEKSRIESLQQFLCKDELKRAGEFRFQKDRNSFIACRGMLRRFVGFYLNLKPEQIEFSYNPYGKPFLNGSDLSFNLSHSHELALYAFTYGRKIGIDIEHIPQNFSWEEIAENFFSPREVDMLYSAPPHIQKKAFFDCWTRKEAYIKATGMGLSIPLQSFDVSLIPGEPAELIANRGKPEEVSRWFLKELVIHPDYAAALAVEGTKPEIINIFL